MPHFVVLHLSYCIINLKKSNLIERLEISSSTIAKTTKNETVFLQIIEKICRELDCDFGDIVRYVKEE
ncbi:MAG: helix-turn-helix domain-containing protein [Eubacterium sp.]|jgi:DNA-binding Xre family transcriptional regulator